MKNPLTNPLHGASDPETDQQNTSTDSMTSPPPFLIKNDSTLRTAMQRVDEKEKLMKPADSSRTLSHTEQNRSMPENALRAMADQTRSELSRLRNHLDLLEEVHKKKINQLDHDHKIAIEQNDNAIQGLQDKILEIQLEIENLKATGENLNNAHELNVSRITDEHDKKIMIQNRMIQAQQAALELLATPINSDIKTEVKSDIKSEDEK